MQIQLDTSTCAVRFGNKYKLSEKTIKLIEKKTRLSYDEMRFLPIDETTQLIRKRVPFGEKIKKVFSDIKLSIGRYIKK